MDLDQLGDLPSLKVLALGRYIFADKRQTDWIASLGQKNMSGGLEELYLDECCVLFRVDQQGPFVANGFSVPGTVMDHNTDIGRIEYRRRWHHVLSEWRISMKGLKKFVMGVGDFGFPTRSMGSFSPWGPITGAMLNANDPPEWYFGHNRHRFFADPGPKDVAVSLFDAYRSRRTVSMAVPMGNYLLGAGLTQSRRAQMVYARCDVSMPYGWFIEDQAMESIFDRSGRAWAPEAETVGLDNAAYALLMETIRDRLRS